jgi:hypothetical protein
MSLHAVSHSVLHPETKVSNPVELLARCLASDFQVLREAIAAHVVRPDILRCNKKLVRKLADPLTLNDVRVLADIYPRLGFGFETRHRELVRTLALKSFENEWLF